MVKVLLRGYYGFGNLGDDVLMLAAYRTVKRIYPESSVTICANGSAAAYIPHLLNEAVPVVKDDSTFQGHLTVLGGGGIFFDFQKGKSKNLAANLIITTIGLAAFSRLYARIKSWRSAQGVSTAQTIGIGIGFGTYTSSSRKFLYDAVILGRLNWLSVRDDDSRKNALRVGVSCPIGVHADLAFSPSLWEGKLTARQRAIGVVLRDWPFDSHQHVVLIKQILHEFPEYEFRFFSFDPSHDQFFIGTFGGSYTMHKWDAGVTDLRAYSNKLAECQLLITSRAHGAIIGACLGVPSVCLAIEPKLERVAEMLSESSMVLSPLLPMAQFKTSIHQFLSTLEYRQQAVKRDVERNQRKLEELEMDVRKFIARTK